MVFLPSNLRVKQESPTDFLVMPPVPSDFAKMYTADERHDFLRYDSLSFIYTNLNSSKLRLWDAFGEIDKANKAKTSVNQSLQRSLQINNAREFIEQVSATLEFPNKVASTYPPVTDVPDSINDTIGMLPRHLEQISEIRAAIERADFNALTEAACLSIAKTASRLEYPLSTIKKWLADKEKDLAEIAAKYAMKASDHNNNLVS